jgi:uncharacterized protein (DUF433 family)
MTTDITIVNHGRGPQLSTSRITVLDLVPYFQEGSSYAEIIRWIPTLSHEEISVVERYYRDHQQECDDWDREARARRQKQVELQRKQFPELQGTMEERVSRLQRLLEKRQQERNGERHPG